MLVDQSYWQSAIAARATSAVKVSCAGMAHGMHVKCQNLVSLVAELSIR
jgi:hypothetical protein